MTEVAQRGDEVKWIGSLDAILVQKLAGLGTLKLIPSFLSCAQSQRSEPSTLVIKFVPTLVDCKILGSMPSSCAVL